MNDQPVFPTTVYDGDTYLALRGMTLRDYFATKAMILIFQLPHNSIKPDFDHISRGAYLMADAMLKARDSK